MSVRYPPKTSFNTLYLIEKEMFDRILPLLNEVEKQELNDLQERNKPYQDPEEGDENIGQPTATSEISQDEVKIGGELSPNNPEQQQQSQEKLKIGDALKIKPVKQQHKEKKYSCDVCVNKKFTTKSSLKRHNKTFHTPKQFIKQDIDSKEVANSPVDLSAKKNILKRGFSNNGDYLDEEPSQKHVKFDLKRKFSDDSESRSEEPFQKTLKLSQGIKRKAINNIEYPPKKRFHWSSF